MIANEREYVHTRKQLGLLDSLLEDIASGRAGDESLVDIQVAALESQIADLRAEMKEYERLQSGKVTTIRVSGLAGVADALIKARIARGWNQADLANALGLAEQQIQRYESTRYAGTSLSRLCEVAEALGADINEVLTLRAS